MNWISVDDRLPEIILQWGCSGHLLLYLNGDYSTGYLDIDKQFHCDGFRGQPTHWMLIEPPKLTNNE